MYRSTSLPLKPINKADIFSFNIEYKMVYPKEKIFFLVQTDQVLFTEDTRMLFLHKIRRSVFYEIGINSFCSSNSVKYGGPHLYVQLPFGVTILFIIYICSPQITEYFVSIMGP